MQSNFLVAELIYVLNKTVEEVAVVANDNECAVEFLQRFFQHVFRAHVEVIGRLVENEQIHWLEQQLQQGKACAFAAAKHFHFLHRFLAAEHECAKHIFYFCSDVAFCNVVDSLKHSEVFVEQRSLILGKIANHHVMPKG